MKISIEWLKDFVQIKESLDDLVNLLTDLGLEAEASPIPQELPGVVIGKKGEDIDRMREEVTKKMGIPVTLSIQEIRKPDLDAKLLAESVAQQLERRVMFRRAIKRAVQNAMRQGAQGVKVRVAGRLGGAEIARAEWHKEGRVPLHTLRADIDYGFAEALTTYGIIGVKVWIYKGELMAKDVEKEKKERVKNATTSKN